MSAEDKLKNAAQDVTGKAKEAVGTVTGNDSLKAEGKLDQTKADLKQSGEKIKDALSD